MKKILFVIDVPSGGGAQRAMLNIIENLDKEKFTPELAVVKKYTRKKRSIFRNCEDTLS